MRCSPVVWGVAALLGLAGGAARVQARELRAEEPRVAPLQDSAALVPVLSAGNNDFACALFHCVARGEDNAIISAYGAAEALAMAYAGARGETARQMAHALCFHLPSDQLHAAFNAMDHHLSALNAEQVVLRTANAVWVVWVDDIRPVYLETLARHYGAGIQQVEKEGSSRALEDTINRWVCDQTEGVVRDLIPPDADKLVPPTVVVASATHLKAAWLHPFPPQLTREEDFVRLDGSRVKAPMMSQFFTAFRYAANDAYQSIELPYVGEKVSLVVILPREGRYQEIQHRLKASELERVVSELEGSATRMETRRVKLPRFRFASGYGLKPVLSALGMPIAFSEKADFSGISSLPFHIAEVWHKTAIALDEQGTEVGSGTAVGLPGGRLAGEPEPFIADRPFLFFIRDRQTNAILFLGRVMDPTQ